MYFEDVLDAFASNRKIFEIPMREGEIIRKMQLRINDQKKPISTKQVKMVTAILRKHRFFFDQSLIDMLKTFEADPQYRLVPYKALDIPREVRYVGASRLAFSFKYDERLKRKIGGIGDALWCDNVGRPKDESNAKWGGCWVVTASNFSITKSLFELIAKEQFEYDADVMDFLNAAIATYEQPGGKISTAFVHNDTIRVTYRGDTPNMFMELFDDIKFRIS